MAKFREFYVPPGAGSNFLAGKCLWTNNADSRDYTDHKDLGPNEYYFDREQINKNWSFLSEINPAKYDIHLQEFLEENLNTISKIKKVLKELNNIINSVQNDNSWIVHTINNIHLMWDHDCSYHCDTFINFDYPELSIVEEKIREVEDYFAKCREYYWNICEKNDYNVSMISHKRPLESISPRLKLPENFKTLAMELDSKTTMFTGALEDIKSDNYEPNAYTHNLGHQSDENFRCVQNSDDSVSYRKIFFENNFEEIRRMYDFFGNVNYFDENKTVIMKEFKDYYDNNMIVIKDFMPLFYEQIKSR
jgi:hypothetical protein